MPAEQGGETGRKIYFREKAEGIGKEIEQGGKDPFQYY